MLSDMSKFMKFREWYTTPLEDGLEEAFYPDGRGYHLKEVAPKEARLAYEEMYEPEELVDEHGLPIRQDGMSAYY